MQSRNLHSEIEALKLELAEKEILLETFLKSKEEFQRTKLILEEIKGIKDRIEDLIIKKEKY